MSEVAFSEEVTSEVLNNIGVDLGLTEFSYFEDSMPYAVHQLNQITSDLVSAGVLRTGENGALGCEVIASGGMAYVQAGVIVFASGAKIRITSPAGVDLIAGTYIYALNDSTTGRASLMVSEAAPSGDYVLLAEVDSEGTLADRRNGCVAKVTLPADIQNVYREFTVELNGFEETTVDIGTNAYSYIILLSGTVARDGGVRAFGVIYKNAFLSEEGIETTVNVENPYNAKWEWCYSFERNGHYQKVKMLDVYGGGVANDVSVIKLLVI